VSVGVGVGVEVNGFKLDSGDGSGIRSFNSKAAWNASICLSHQNGHDQSVEYGTVGKGATYSSLRKVSSSNCLALVEVCCL
jgi:hypothetical protein